MNIRLLGVTLLAGLAAIAVTTAQKHAFRPVASSPPPRSSHTVEAMHQALAQLGARSDVGSLFALARPRGQARIEPLEGFQISNSLHLSPFTTRTLHPAATVLRAGNGTARWIEGALGSSATYAERSEKSAPAALASTDGRSRAAVAGALGALNEYRSELGIATPNNEFTLIDATTDALGQQHVRMEQTYAGLPLWGRDLSVHIDPEGSVYLINGRIEPTLTDATMGPTTPALSAEGALAAVVADMQARGRWAPVAGNAARLLQIDPPTVRAVLYPNERGEVRLAWEVTCHPNLAEHYLHIIDAATGTILKRIGQHCSLSNHSGAPVAIKDGKAESVSSAGTFENATANDLNGASRSIRTYHSTNGQYYMVWDLPNLNSGASNLPDEPSGGALTLSLDNSDLTPQSQLQHIISTGNVWSDPAAVSAHYNSRVAYDYFKNTFDRKAIDGRDQSIISIVHATENGQPMDNAYWNGRSMIYGDGAQQFKSLAGGLDVSGHEMAHGVIGNSAALIYENQSGALNESFADVFGMMIDRDDFLMGEDIMQPGEGVALRDLEHPDNAQLSGPQPAHMNDFRQLGPDQDNGGVHINSGIPNRAAVLVVQAIGREKTEQIYYRALTTYLTRSSQFIDCRNAVERAAKDLYGEGTEASAVRTAFDAVGIGSGSGSNGDENDVPAQSGGASYIAFVVGDGRIGRLDTQTGEIVAYNDPEARVRITNADVAQLSVDRAGQHLWFVNTSGRLAVLTVASGALATLDNLAIRQPGDLWNAAITPDESAVALVSNQSNDPNIYFADNSGLFLTLPLLPETTQDGIRDRSIRYPDVISWSPNAALPRLAFDALHSVQVGGSTEEYWSIYEIDFAGRTIFPLLAPLPGGVSAGNVTYSATDPDLIAYNVLEDGAAEIVLANYATGQQGALGLLQVGIADGMRPTFSPNNSALAFASESRASIFIVTLSTGDLAEVSLGVPATNPVWFVNGPPAAVKNEAVSLVIGEATPNPAGTHATLQLSLRDPQQVRAELIDAMGRTVAVPFNGRMSAGAGTIPLNVATLPAGFYFVRIATGSTVALRPLTVAR